MRIQWVGGHGFDPDLGEMKLGDERDTTEAIGRKRIKDGLAEEVVIKKRTFSTKEDKK